MGPERDVGGRVRAVRRLLVPWVVRDIRSRYRQSTLDLAWAVVTPILTVVGYGLVLTRFFGVDSSPVPYLSFAWAGIAMWTFVSGGLIAASWSLVGNAELLRKVAFPPEVVPVAAVLTTAVDLVVALGILFLLAVVQDVGWSVTILGAVPVLAVATLWTLAAGVFLAAVTSFRRDAAHGVSALLRVGVFVTPVMYPLSQIPAEFRWIGSVNPIAVFVDGFRQSVLAHRWPTWSLLGWHTLGAGALALVSVVTIRRLEGRLADVV